VIATWISLVAGALVGAGVYLIVAGLRPHLRPGGLPTTPGPRPGQDRRVLQAGLAVIVALVVLVLSGWPVGALLAAGEDAQAGLRPGAAAREQRGDQGGEHEGWSRQSHGDPPLGGTGFAGSRSIMAATGARAAILVPDNAFRAPGQSIAQL